MTLASPLRYLQGALARGNPALRRAQGRRPVILAALVVVALGQTGCQSGGCGGCGLRGLRERVFPARESAGCSGCSGIGGEAPPLVYGSPAVAAPAPVGAPVGGGTTIMTPSDSLPSALEPIPSATPGPPPSGTDSGVKEGAVKGSAGKAAYEAYRPRFDTSRRGADLARSNAPGPESTPRSAQGRSASNAGANEPNPLDNLPPLDLPRDLTNRATPTPVSTPDSERRPTAAAGPAPAAEALADRTPTLPAPAPTEMTVAPGIRRFSGVGTQLAGGSVPDSAGLDWLVEKSYKTLLDLRETAAVPASYRADAETRGLRYRALPVTVQSLEAPLLAKFEAELADAGSRPLYFCDADGTRAAALWFLHKVTVDKVDPQLARRDAEELGPLDGDWWKAVNAYVERWKAATPAPATGANMPAVPGAGHAPSDTADVTAPRFDEPVQPLARR